MATAPSGGTGTAPAPNQLTPGVNPATAAATGAPYDPNAPATTGADQASAQAIFAQTLQAYGFDAADIQALTDWAHGQITGAGSPTGLPVPESQVALNLMKTPQFANRFPGIVAQQKAGVPVTSPGDYVNYEHYAYATAHAAGLPAGLLNSEVIGNLIASHVDQQELSDRITKGYQAVAETLPETRKYMKDTFNVDEGHLAAYFLDPARATPFLLQQATAAQIGGAGVAAGFTEGGLPGALTLKAAQLGVTAAQGAQALSGETATELALTRGQLGQPAGPGTIGEETLAKSALIQDEASRRAVQLAQETRKAPLEGGGGFGATQRGSAVGAVGEQGAANQGRG